MIGDALNERGPGADAGSQAHAKVLALATSLASLLPYRVLVWLAIRFDTPGAFELSDLGSSFWFDAHYHRWVRHDKRRSR